MKHLPDIFNVSWLGASLRSDKLTPHLSKLTAGFLRFDNLIPARSSAWRCPVSGTALSLAVSPSPRRQRQDLVEASSDLGSHLLRSANGRKVRAAADSASHLLKAVIANFWKMLSAGWDSFVSWASYKKSARTPPHPGVGAVLPHRRYS